MKSSQTLSNAKKYLLPRIRNNNEPSWTTGTPKPKPQTGQFIGFTGTPLLKKDKQNSNEVFGAYIHTYKFNEAVTDIEEAIAQYEQEIQIADNSDA